MNWLVGLILLGLVCFSNFSGYLLPWDQLAFWAVTIFINMIGYIHFVGVTIAQLLRGGDEIGAATLTNFYAIHTGIFRFFLLLLAITISLTSAVLTVAAVLFDDFVIHTISAAAADIYTRGIFPLVGLLVWYILGYFIFTKRFRYKRSEAVMAGFVFMVIAMVCLTIIGIWFRGPGMQLVLPF